MDHGPPLEDLLMSIHSETSFLATTAMGQLIQNQFSNPRHMAANLRRIKSVMSNSILSSFSSARNDGAGDIGDWEYQQAMSYKEKLKSPLLQLPIKARIIIWMKLDNEDIRNLRLVCSAMKDEMDREYGIPFILDCTHEDSVHLLHDVKVRTCRVKRLQSLTYFNFFAQPESLLELHFDRDILLTQETLEYMFRKFPQLRRISFSNRDCLQQYENGIIQLITPTDTALLLERVGEAKNVQGVRTVYDSKLTTMDWKLELSPKQNCPLGFFHCHIPAQSHHSQVQEDVLKFLNSQTNLFDLRCELVGQCWKQYLELIQMNSKKLISLNLFGLKCSAREPFDLSVLSSCDNLRFLSLGGEDSFVSSEIEMFPFVSIVGVQHLKELKKLCTLTLRQVHLTERDFNELKSNQTKQLWIRLSFSLVGKEEIDELKIGMYTDATNNLEHDWADQGDDEECFNDELVTQSSDWGPNLVTGLVITAWCLLC